MDQSATWKLLESGDPVMWLATTERDGQRGGLVATTVTSASIIPESPRVVLTLAKQHHTTGLIVDCRQFALSLMAARSVELALRFGACSGHDADKWEGLSLRRTTAGMPVPEEVVGWADCRVESLMDIGDRFVVLAACEAAWLDESFPVMRLSTFLAGTDEAQRQRLKMLREQDARRDAAALEVWRGGNG